MSLQYHEVQITPFEVGALHSVIATARLHISEDDLRMVEQVETAYRWLAYARSGLFEQWQALPDGHHLREAYRDEVWTWDDQDLASIPEDRLVSPDDLPGSDAVDLQGFRRPKPEELADG